MRFNLRILLAFTLSTALIPLLAAVITFYFEEKSERRQLPIVAWPYRDVYVVGLRGPVFLATSDDLYLSNRVYLRLRAIFCAPPYREQQLEYLQTLLQENKHGFVTTTLQLNEDWIAVANGVEACTHAIRIREGNKTLDYPLQWKPQSIGVSVHPKFVIFPTRSYPRHFVLVTRDEEGPLIISTLYKQYFSHMQTSNIGDFFFNTLLATAFAVYAIFFWIIYKFSRRHTQKAGAEKSEP